jgi:hypothetical protein
VTAAFAERLMHRSDASNSCGGFRSLNRLCWR